MMLQTRVMVCLLLLTTESNASIILQPFVLLSHLRCLIFLYAEKCFLPWWNIVDGSVTMTRLNLLWPKDSGLMAMGDGKLDLILSASVCNLHFCAVSNGLLTFLRLFVRKCPCFAVLVARELFWTCLRLMYLSQKRSSMIMFLVIKKSSCVPGLSLSCLLLLNCTIFGEWNTLTGQWHKHWVDCNENIRSFHC